MKFWVHIDATANQILDGRGVKIAVGNIKAGTATVHKPSADAKIWADHEAAMKFMQRNYEGVIRDLGNRIEVDVIDDRLPAKTFAMVEVEVS